MKAKQYILAGLIGFILGMAVWAWLSRDKRPDPVPLNNYITKTVIVDWIGPPKPYPLGVKPSTVYLYNPLNDSLKLIRINDSLQAVIDSMSGDTVFISDGFLTLFPESPKFIGLDLKKDSLGITLLYPNLQFLSKVYPLYLDHYQYNMDKDSLYAKPLIKPILGGVPTKLRAALSSGLSYEFLEKQWAGKLNFDMGYSRIMLGSEARITIENKPQLSLSLKAGFKIKEWERK